VTDILTIAVNNLTAPMVLFFALGFGAALLRSDLSFPEAAAKAISLYLLLAIGFKGGVAVAESGVTGTLIASLLAGVVLSCLIPMIAFALLKMLTRLPRVDMAAIAGHYGSISVVTFVAGDAMITSQQLAGEGFMVAVAAAMEAPAILIALYLAADRTAAPKGKAEERNGDLLREVLLNGSIVLLIGAFIIGWISGPEGMHEVESFVVSPFKGVLCLFLLDMGLIAGRGLRSSAGVLTWRLIFFGLIMPPIGATFGLIAAALIGLSVGGAILLMILSASASYIAVPAAMRVALPEARPSLYLTLSLGVTFPFNLTLGLPLYSALAHSFLG